MSYIKKYLEELDDKKDIEDNIREIDPEPTPEEESYAFINDSWDEIRKESYSQDIQERKKFAERAYGLTCSWVGFLIVMTIFQFICGKSESLGLENYTFNIVFTTTTASIFGFWYLVGKYLFNTKNSNNSTHTAPAPDNLPLE